MDAPPPSACERMAEVADRLGAQHTDPRVFLRHLGEEVAGIRPGLAGLLDLLRGGRNPVPGGGFRAPFDDETAGQARHFAGVARAAALLGPGPTRWVSEHVRRDPARSPDGRLSLVAVALAAELLDGRRATDEAGDWIRRHVCHDG